MTQPLDIDPTDVGDAAAGWGALGSDFEAPAPDVSGDWPTHQAAAGAVQAARQATTSLQQRIATTADETRDGSGKYLNTDTDGAAMLSGVGSILQSAGSPTGQVAEAVFGTVGDVAGAAASGVSGIVGALAGVATGKDEGNGTADGDQQNMGQLPPGLVEDMAQQREEAYVAGLSPEQIDHLTHWSG
jgi:hypothetical protein